MAIITFDDLMKGFGVVTVMNACVYELKSDKAYSGSRGCGTASNGALSPEDFVCTHEYLDTLKIANFTQEGPTKTITGGQYANPLIKYGKTMTAEIQDALGSASTLVRFMGAEYDGGMATFTIKEETPAQTVFKASFIKDGDKPYDAATSAGQIKVTVNGTIAALASSSPIAEGQVTLAAAPAKDAVVVVSRLGGRLSITDKFPGPFAIEGESFFIDQKSGEKKSVYILIPQYLPDAILTLTQDSEGDATVFDLNGSIAMTDIADRADGAKRSIFYEIRDKSFFSAR